jgi:AraC-like DNA-binding protein
MTEMPGAEPAAGPLVGDGPLARAGLSHVLFSDGSVGVGITRMPVADARWSAATTIGDDHHVVYSYTPLCVGFEGAGDYVVTPNEVVCQRAGQVYQRRQLYSGQELSVFAAVNPAAGHLVGLGWLASPRSPLIASLPAPLSAGAWRLAHELAGQPAARRSDLEYAERAAALIAATASLLEVQGPRSGAARAATVRAHRSLAGAVCEHLATSYADPALPLARLAADIGASPYHLSRVFRAVTGQSIHQYRIQLRLRAVLAGLASGQQVTELAVTCGFASPSHLSQLFGRYFKISPSKLRDELLNLRGALPPVDRPES